MSSAVSRPEAADSQSALKHFQQLLEFEMDCWDVHHAISNKRQDFVLLMSEARKPLRRGMSAVPLVSQIHK